MLSKFTDKSQNNSNMSENAINFVESMFNQKLMNKDQIEELVSKLNSSKIFVNMIIHDFRNPTISQKAGNT